LALQRRFILQAFRALGDASEQLGADQVALVLAWVADAQVASTLDLGRGIRCRMGYDHVLIERDDVELIQDTTGLIPANTAVIIPQHSVHHSLYNEDLAHRYGLQLRVSDVANPTDADKCICVPRGVDVMLRTRRAGDRFCPRGMAGRSRKLKDWMIDRKIPRHLRDSIPLIEAGGRIVAIYSLQTWHLAEVLDDEADCMYVILGGCRPSN
jgi:tRNA(Ile)-lysidine synthase